MEHPTGQFGTAIDAMEDAVERLWSLPDWTQWITFCGQGEGGRPDSYHCADIRMLGHSIDVGDQPLDVDQIIATAGAESGSLVADGVHYSIAGASSREVAVLLDAIFRFHLGVRPHAGEDDYAVGVEW